MTDRRRSKSLSDLDSSPYGDMMVTRLAGLAIFKGLNEETINELAGRMLHRMFRKDDVIIREGSTGHSLYLILSGSTFAYSEKSECILSNMTTGAIFGEIGALYDTKRTATVRVSTNFCKVAVLQRNDLDKVLNGSPELLVRLKERARIHLKSDSERFKDLDSVSIIVSDMKVFDGYPFWEAETIRLFLADSITFRIPKGFHIPLSASSVLLLVKGEASLMGIGTKGEPIKSGTVIDKEKFNMFDFVQTETSCVFIVATENVYSSFIEGVSIYEEKEDTTNDTSIIPIDKTIMFTKSIQFVEHEADDKSPRKKKKARKVQDIRVDMSKNPAFVFDNSIQDLENGVKYLKLDNCWQISDDAIFFICKNLGSLEELYLSDCWNLTRNSLVSLGSLNKLKILQVANLEAVDDVVVSSFPVGLEQLDVSFCSNIDNVKCFAHLKNLKQLDARRCTLQRASDTLPESLESLDLSECHLLKDDVLIKAIDGCKNTLKRLSLSCCHSLSHSCLSALCQLNSLVELNISNCDNFVCDLSLKSLLDALTCLTTLDISYNGNIHNLLPLVTEHPAVKYLSYTHCSGIDSTQASILQNKFNNK